MIYLTLFYEFFKIGLFTFGGGYAMIPLIEQTTISHGWIDMETLLNMIAISESTPGPFAINMATFVGFTQAGFGGACMTTLGVCMPSFIIILIVAKLATKVNTNNRYLQGTLYGVKPIVVGLIGVAFISMMLKNLFGYTSYTTPILAENIDIVGIVIAVLMATLLLVRKKTSVLTIVILSGLCGMLFYYIESIV